MAALLLLPDTAFCWTWTRAFRNLPKCCSLWAASHIMFWFKWQRSKLVQVLVHSSAVRWHDHSSILVPSTVHMLNSFIRLSISFLSSVFWPSTYRIQTQTQMYMSIGFYLERSAQRFRSEHRNLGKTGFFFFFGQNFTRVNLMKYNNTTDTIFNLVSCL